MINHLQEHEHAFLDENNVVILVAVFEESAHNHSLLEDIKIANKANRIICCCEHGRADVGRKWDDQLNAWEPLPEFFPLEEVAEEFQV